MRLALFGGTFDPIHNAHLTVAREAAGQFHLDQVWFIPAAHPPHKSDQSGAPYEDRFRMTELACQADSRFVASRLEDGEGQSYSLDTVERVRELGEQPYFIIGADAFAEITTWHRWQDLVRLTEFIVVTRPGHRYATPPGARACIGWKTRRTARILFRNKAEAGDRGDSGGFASSRRPLYSRAQVISTFGKANRSAKFLTASTSLNQAVMHL